VHDPALSAVTGIIDLVEVSIFPDHDSILELVADYSADHAHVDRELPIRFQSILTFRLWHMDVPVILTGHP
jgi:cupin superfamily acireductone dioxygenase involved in methionine salvage